MYQRLFVCCHKTDRLLLSPLSYDFYSTAVPAFFFGKSVGGICEQVCKIQLVTFQRKDFSQEFVMLFVNWLQNCTLVVVQNTTFEDTTPNQFSRGIFCVSVLGCQNSIPLFVFITTSLPS